MQYNVVDLNTGKILISGTCQEIAFWWRGKFRNRKGNISFEGLNVTGKDTVARKERDGFISIKVCGEYLTLPAFKTVYYLRSYQVLDKNGRSIDIRSWDKAVWAYVPPSRRLARGWMSGGKTHHHRTSGPSMWHGTFSASMVSVDEAELLEDGLPFPIRVNTGVRLPFNTNTVWDYYDEHRWHQKSKSWKDQTKARKQWAKHKRSGKSQRREDEWARLDPDWTAVEAEEASAASPCGNSKLQEAA